MWKVLFNVFVGVLLVFLYCEEEVFFMVCEKTKHKKIKILFHIESSIRSRGSVFLRTLTDPRFHSIWFHFFSISSRIRIRLTLNVSNSSQIQIGFNSCRSESSLPEDENKCISISYFLHNM